MKGPAVPMAAVMQLQGILSYVWPIPLGKNSMKQLVALQRLFNQEIKQQQEFSIGPLTSQDMKNSSVPNIPTMMDLFYDR